ncbi:MAG: hypothetical protein M3680_13690 [Myxococcota bacterium]|nr:hypothetical protein [Myxococcota bacterium]
MRTTKRVVMALILVVGSCASAKDDAAPAPTPARELGSGSARIRGGGIRMDVQLGRPFAQRPAKQGSIVVKPRAVVTP